MAKQERKKPRRIFFVPSNPWDDKNRWIDLDDLTLVAQKDKNKMFITSKGNWIFHDGFFGSYDKNLYQHWEDDKAKRWLLDKGFEAELAEHDPKWINDHQL